MFPPVLSVLSSSSIRVAFHPPHAPNGEIVSYSLARYLSTSSTPTFISLNVSALPTANGSFVYEDTSLSPFINYTYSLTVCTSADCSTSEMVWSVTDEAIPTGLRAPLVRTVSESSIVVSWDAPTQSNGIVQSYNILQSSLGVEVAANVATFPNCCEEYLNANSTVAGDSCSKVAQVNESTLSYMVTALQAYSNYHFCLIATNGAGSTFSPTSNVTQTLAALMPISGPNLTATTVNSTAIYLSWSSLDVSQLLGPFRGYSLYRRVVGQEAPGEALYSGDEQDFTATDLVASTEYIFLVSFRGCILLCWSLL